MSETIKVAITADASDFQAAVAKASASADRFESRAGATAKAARQAGQGGKEGSMGFLAFSQAVEDAQYGIRGVLNNIPQMVMGFGGSAGIAGVLSLAAVAAYGAYQAFKSLSGINEIEKWAKDSSKAVSDFTAKLRENADETARIQGAQAGESDRAFRRFQAGVGIERDLSADDLLASIKTREEAVQRARRAQDELAAALAPSAVSGETFRGQGEREWQVAAIKYTTDQTRATKDLATAQETLNQLGEKWNKIQAAQTEQLTANQAARSQAMAEAETLRQTIASKEAERTRDLAMAKAAPEGSTDAKRFAGRAEALAKEISESKALLDQQREEIKLRDELIQKILQEGNAAKTALDQKAAAVRADKAALQDQIKNREALAKAEAMAIQFRALQGQNADLQKAADKAPDQTRAANEFADELQVANAALEVGKKQSEELEKQLRLRREAKELADQTGMSEKDAGILTKALDDARAKAEKLPTGTIAERAAARAKERDEERQRKRDEAVQEAARNREERKRQREGSKLDPKDKPVDLEKEADRVRREAAEREKKSREDVNKNIEKQTKLQEEIKELFQKLAAA